MKNKKNLFMALGLATVLGLGAVGANHMYAQHPDGGGDDKKAKKVEKTIEIEDENGVRTMTVTTITDGEKKVETFTGDAIDAYLKKEKAQMEIHHGGDDKKAKKVEKSIDIQEENGVRTMTVTTTTDGVEKVEVFTGDAIDEYLKKEHAQMQFHHSGDGEGHEMRVMVFATDDHVDGAESHSFHFDVDGEMPEHMKLLTEELKGLEGLSEEEIEAKIQELMKEMHGEDGMPNHMIRVMVDDADVTVTDGAFSEDDLERIEIQVIENGNQPSEVDETVTVDVNVDDNGETKTVIVKKCMTKIIVLDDLTSDEMKDLKIEGNNALEVTDMSFYPNPNDGKFTVEFELPADDKTRVTITDMQGREVYKTTVSGKGKHTLNVDISTENKGVYILNLWQGKQSKHQKLVIE